jgi:DNA (cytosine-5)-methyltransferase 1
MSNPTLVSLFTGAGGLDAGLEAAGFHTVAANDFDKDCIATLEAARVASIPIAGSGRRHLSGTKIVPGPIESLSPADLRPRRAPAEWVPDLLAGGPPCQPFSSAGKMLSIHDPRGRLFEDFVRFADGLRPKYILFENVRGLVTARGPRGEPGEVIHEVMQAFQEIGYATSFHLLNAADYGAYQRRVRLFMFGARVAPVPTFPSPTHGRAGGSSLLHGLQPWRTLGEFLETRREVKPEQIIRPSPALAAQLADLGEGTGLKSAGAREATRPGGHWGYKQGTFIADRSKPARTVTAASTQDWIRDRDGVLRRLSEDECAGLQGFPAGWPFQGNAASRFRQIGNAVPYTFGLVLGRAIVEALRVATEDHRPESHPLPDSFHEAIDYTRRDSLRNGEHRRNAQRLALAGVEVHHIKGLGSQDRRLDAEPQLLLEDLWTSVGDGGGLEPDVRDHVAVAHDTDDGLGVAREHNVG